MNFELYSEARGAGAPLVLIPGFASGAWVWRWQVEALAANFQVVTFDPRGVSRSPAAAGEAPAGLTAMAADVAALLDCLKIEKANVLGASFGGFVAQAFALAFPARLDKLILACTSFGGKNHVAPAPEILLAFAATDNLNQRERIRNFMIPAFTPEFRRARPDVVETVCALREQNCVPEAVYLAQLQAATEFDFENRVGEIKAETLCLTGDADIVVPPANSRNLAAKIPNSRLETIKGGSHLFFIEKSDEFNLIVTDFLKQ